VFRDVLHGIINATEQLNDKIFSRHGICSFLTVWSLSE
jgi:hypothetical protein